MKYILYCRKSTDTEDKQVLSLSSQESEMMQIAEREGLEIVSILKESRSAKEPGRPVFAEMLQIISSGKADAILCWKIDRLTRNPVDGGQIQWLLQTGKISCVRTYERTYQPSDNVLLMSIEQAMANQYVRDLSVNVKRGNRAKLERGEWPSRGPIGYLNDKVARSVVVDPKTRPAVLRCFELYSSGIYSMKQVYKILNSEGYRTTGGYKFGKSKVEAILKNPFYYGVMVRDGKYYQGKHEPLISKTQFDHVQEIFAGKRRPQSQTKFFPLRGLLTCDLCGCLYTASLKKNHQYYYCTNGKNICDAHLNYLRSEDANNLAGDALGNVRFDEEIIEIMYEAARQRYTDGSEYQDTTRARLEARLQALEEQEITAFDAYSAKLLRPELYERKVQEINAERLAVQNDLKTLPQKSPLATLEPTKNLFLKGNRAKKKFLDNNDIQKRDVAFEILWNLSLKDGNVAQTKYKEQYALLASTPKNADFETLCARQGSNLRPSP